MQRSGGLADLVEKDRALVRDLEEPCLLAVGSGECRPFERSSVLIRLEGAGDAQL